MMLKSLFAAGAAGILFLATSVAQAVTIDNESLPNGTEMVAYHAELRALGGTGPYTWSAARQGMSRRANTWSEVASLGTAQEWYADDDAWPLALPFEFPFYGDTYTNIWISSNGNIFFSNDASRNPRQDIQQEHYATEVKLSNWKMLSVGWCDSGTDSDHPIYTYVEANRAVIRFDAARGANIIKAAAELKADGSIILRYSTDDSSEVNERGDVGVSAGTGKDYIYRTSSALSLHGTAVEDILFALSPVPMPDGIELSSDGVLSGTMETNGTFGLVVTLTDSASASATKYFPLVIAQNPNRPPVITAQTPAADATQTLAHGESVDFAVSATDPESHALTYNWKVNGVNKASGSANWTWATGFYDGGNFTVTCDVSDGLWTRTATWNVYVSRGLAWYVNGTTGNDGNTGYESASPFKTITKALEKAIDGETIFVAEGTYKEGYFEDGGYKYPNLSVTDGRHLTIRATGARDATIIDAEGQSSCLWLNTKQNVNTNVVVEGFTLRNGQGSWKVGNGNYGGGAFGGWLKGCRIIDCDSAGNGGGAVYAKLEDCAIEGCYAHYSGAGLYGCEADRCRIVGNVISNYNYSVYGAGVCGGTTANSLIAYNRIDSTCTGTGYGAGAGYGAKLYNCTVYANTNNATTAHGGGMDNDVNSARQYNTIIYGNIAHGEVSELYITDEYESLFFNCCTNDPSFKNAAGGDFTLRPTSVCHNAGDNAMVSGATDLAGAARIQEGMVDIGAFEYVPIMTITAEPTQATAGTAYSYTLTQTGGADPIAWSIDASVPMSGELVATKSFAAKGEKILGWSGGSSKIDLPFTFTYAGKSYTHAVVNTYGYLALDDGSYQSFWGYNYSISDITILERPLIMPYFSYNWGTDFEGGGVFVDRSLEDQVTIRWATQYQNDYRANFSATLYKDGSIRFAYGSIDEEYETPNIIGLSYGDGAQYLDVKSQFGGSASDDILFRPLSMPDELTVSGNQLVGTMTKGGSYYFNVTATEKGGETQKKVVSLDVLSNYTLHFDGNGNKTGSAPADKNLTSVEEYVLPEPGMACGCARFLGWATNATAAATYQPGDKVKCLTAEDGGSVTLYAAWEDVFVLEFDNNAPGAVGQHVFYTNAIGKTFTIYRDQGATTNIVDFGAKYFPYRIGWWLKNWNMSVDGSGKVFLVNATSSQYSQSVSSSDFGANRGDVITLHAQWFESNWDFYTSDPQLSGGKWQIRVRGDEYAELAGVSGDFTWTDSVTLPANYGGRAIGSLRDPFTYTYRGVDTKLKHVTIPEGYTNLCEGAFQNLHALESIRFPSTLKVIPLYCCYQCEKLAEAVFAEGNCLISQGAFCRCYGLTEIDLPRGLTNLKYMAFYCCTNLSAFALSPDYVGASDEDSVLANCPITKLEIPASCVGFGYCALNKVSALRFLGDRPTWNVNYANQGKATLFEFPATNTTWNAGKINNYSSVPHKGFVGPIAAFGVTDAYFWTNANETVTFAYAESPLAATVTIPAGVISWGGVDWEIVGFEADAFAGQATTTVYYPISEYAKWEQVTPPAGITLAPVPGTYFTLNFHVNGGDPYPSMTFPPSVTRALPSAKPTKSGYKFLGWATTADGSPVYQADDDYTAGAAGASATLYAKWQEVGNYTIAFKAGCYFSYYVTNMPENIVAAVGTTPTLPNVTPMREGWTFSHWEHDGDAYYPGEVFTEEVGKDTTFSLGAKWNETTVYNLSEADGYGSVWGYSRTGDAVFVNKVTPGPYVETLTLPEGLHGSTSVTMASGFTLPEKINGVWWTYTVDSSSKVHLTAATLSGTTDVVVPSEIAGKTVIELSNSCFKGNKLITSVVLPDTLTTYRYGILGYGCTALTNAVLPATMTSIPSEIFYKATNLRKVVVPAGLTAIEDRAFCGCKALAELDIPVTCTKVADEAFDYDVGSSVRGFDAGGFRFADVAHRILTAADRQACDELVVPDGTVFIGNEALRYNESQRVVIPEGVVQIASAGLGYSSTMKSAELPNTLIKFTYKLFDGSYLKEVSFAGTTGNYDGPGSDKTCGTTTITNVLVRGGAPSWNLKSYFTGLTTVHYDMKRESDWTAYKADYPTLTYVDDLVPYATVVFDANGGEGSLPDMTFVECGVATRLPACSFTRKDFTFLGWATVPDAGGMIEFGDGVNISIPLSARKTTVRLYAQWEESSPKLFGGMIPGDLNPKGGTYNGFIGEDTLGGTFVLTVKKPKKGSTSAAATLTIVDAGTGKKVKITGMIDINTGVGSGGLAGLLVGAKGVAGSLGGVAVQGAVDAAKAKDSAALAVMNGFNKQVYGLVYDDGSGEEAYLTVTFSAKGKVKVAGSFRGAKVSGKAQMSVGDDFCAVPFVWSKKGVSVTFVLWFKKATRELAAVTGLGDAASLVDAGSAGAPPSGSYRFALTASDLIASVPDLIKETPLETVAAFNGSKFDAGKAAKVSYKKGELSIVGDNVSGLALKYSKGALSGSFTIYALTNGKLVKNKFKVSGVIVNGVGYGAATNKKLKAIGVTLTR